MLDLPRILIDIDFVKGTDRCNFLKSYYWIIAFQAYQKFLSGDNTILLEWL